MSNINLELFNSDSDSEYEEENKNSLPWIEKYRPKKLNDIASHENILNILKVFLKSSSLPHILFYGPPGTGKTSAIQSYARELYGSSYKFMVMEINASEDRGIDSVRNKIKQFVNSNCSFQNITSNKNKVNYKLVILDEVDAMTNDAQSILRYVIDNYAENARFCLICNYIKKIDEALQSRCTPFRFSPIDENNMKKIIKKVSDQEKIKITDSGIGCLIKRSNGDLRKMLNFLQSSNMIYKDKINENKLNTCFGYPQKAVIFNIFKSLILENTNECFKIINDNIKNDGISLIDIINEIFQILNKILLDEAKIKKKIKKYIKVEISKDTIKNIIKYLRCIEQNLSINSFDCLQIGGVISSFKLCL